MGDAAHILQPFALGFLHDIDNYRDNGSSKSPDPQLKTQLMSSRLLDS